MAKYTRHTLKKIEDLYKELAYTIRYEKGNFQSGYCIVKDQRLVVINKFFDTEARVNTLTEILSSLDSDPAELSENGKKTLAQWGQGPVDTPEEKASSK